MSQGSSSYQGYPYVKPTVIDIPSLTAEEIAERNKWVNLPRKPVAPKPVVYIDLPQGSSVSQPQQPQPSTTTRPPRSPKEDPEQVVYIDIPDSNSNELLEPTREEESSFVQDTILYDPFKDRRISLQGSDSSSDGSLSPGQRPSPPNTLDLDSGAGVSAGSSGYQSNSFPNTTKHVPAFLANETMLYGQSNDGFPLSPIPISEFPNPPPAYEEVQSTQPRPAQPPPTQVIVTPSANPPVIGIPDLNRKYVKCQHCSINVHTFMRIENGPLTHYIGIFFCFFFSPLILCLYFTTCCDFFKYQNHYCPNCNKKIGHEAPALCQGMVYVETDPY